MGIILSNTSGVPIYEQIKTQLRDQILSGELPEGSKLPSLRQLAKDLRISVLTTTRAYNDLEQEGFIVSMHGKGFFVMPRGADLVKEQLIREVEVALESAISLARRAQMDDAELLTLLKLQLEAENDE